MLDYQRTGFGVKRLDVKMAMSNFAACATATVAAVNRRGVQWRVLGLDMLLAVSVPEVRCYGRVGVMLMGAASGNQRKIKAHRHSARFYVFFRR
jgi:hypothetical protein